tara:strand:- start:1009 stop:1611 length:603 start_codon:yes stop_codon:yes gene_type:complete
MKPIEPQIEHTGKFPILDKYDRVKYLAGLRIPIELKHQGILRRLPNKFYRNDGAVDSIPKHLIEVLEEFGFKVENKSELIESLESKTGHCRCFELYSIGRKARLSIPFYRSVYQELEVFDKGHEDMHAVQFLKLDEVYPILNRRLNLQGYSIDIRKIRDNEEQANIVGLLKVIEDDLDIERLFHIPEIKSAYCYIQRNKL